MKPEVKKRLDHLIFMQRLKIGLIALALAIGVASLLIFVGYEQTVNIDKVIARTPLRGEVLKVTRKGGRKGGYILQIRLKDGSSVQGFSRLPRIPFVGDHMTLMRATHESGQKSYLATGFVNPPK
ncbi:MAG TPA: hypothetical protein ENJ57_02155 [Rhizobiales bacterium]|nr:hypothetical protein [Hyphomicrobiales bacterium]